MKNLSCLLEKPIAHRGYYDNDKIPENSIPAFLLAINKGYAIELDIRLTKDKKIIVFHDSDLRRVCNIKKKIEELTYKELLKYNLFKTKYKIPLLKNILKIIDGKTFLLIELKNFRFNTKLNSQLVKLLNDYNGNFAIQSFNIFDIYWFKKYKSGYIIGILYGNFTGNKFNNLKKILKKTLIFDLLLRTDFISYNINSLPNSYISSIRKRKIIISWTINNEKKYKKALKYSDNFIGENFDLYIKKIH